MVDPTGISRHPLDAADLREANELLVLAALRAESVAEGAFQQLADLARAHQHDPLTGLPIRAILLDRLQIAMTMAQRHDTYAAGSSSTSTTSRPSTMYWVTPGVTTS